METGQRLAVIRKPAQDVIQANPPGPVPGLSPLMYHLRLVELEIFLAGLKVADDCRQVQRFGVGKGVFSGFDFQAPAIQSVHEGFQYIGHVFKCQPRGARPVFACETIDIPGRRHGRVQAPGIVDVHTVQQPGLNARGIHQTQRTAHMGCKIQRHAGTGTRNDADPVQHKVLLLTGEPGQLPGRLFGGAQ